MDCFTTEWFCCSGVNVDIFTADGFQDAESVLRGVFERRIAVDGADAQEV